MKTPTLSAQQRPTTWGKLIDKSNNFYQISPNLFRSEQPTSDLSDVLKQHQIDLIISLRSNNQSVDELKNTRLKVVHIPIYTWAMTRQNLLDVMKAIQAAQYNQHNVLVHCYHGSDRTGASIAMYRIIFQNWSIQEALDEMKYGGYGFHIIWFNIEKLFTPENIKWIREQLSNPS